MRIRLLMFLLVLPAFVRPGNAQPVRVLAVTAHPDDEAMFAASMWRIVREQGGLVDLAVITDGAGGYRFSTLAEPLYGLSLTDPEVAARALPDIRRRELRAGADIVGIRHIHHFGQPDAGKIYAVDSVFTDLWDVSAVEDALFTLMKGGGYDAVLTMLPVPQQHAHHKAASILTLRAAHRMDPAERPVLLGSFIGNLPTEVDFRELEGFPETRILESVTPFVLDRATPIGLDGRLDYHIVVNWLIAEHRSQGTMQRLMGAGRYERFWLYAASPDSMRARNVLARMGLEPAD